MAELGSFRRIRGMWTSADKRGHLRTSVEPDLRESPRMAIRGEGHLSWHFGFVPQSSSDADKSGHRGRAPQKRPFSRDLARRPARPEDAALGRPKAGIKPTPNRRGTDPSPRPLSTLTPPSTGSLKRSRRWRLVVKEPPREHVARAVPDAMGSEPDDRQLSANSGNRQTLPTERSRQSPWMAIHGLSGSASSATARWSRGSTTTPGASPAVDRKCA